jgi:gamma-glutamylcyclotransferase (GGCT)/AIG2-like uncharacterized protein YtfP
MREEFERVFVYGTLRPPRPGVPAEASRFYYRVAPYVEGASEAHLPGATLYDAGAFPAARPGEGAIHGDLLIVTPPALDLMDQIEGHPTFFRRSEVTVQTTAGPVTAWVYWAPEELVAERDPIPGGDWFEDVRC